MPDLEPVPDATAAEPSRDLAWWQNEARTAREALARASADVEKLRSDLTLLQVRFDMAQRALGEARPHPESPLVAYQDQDHRALMLRLEELERELSQARVELRKMAELGPTALALVLRMKSLARRLPGMAWLVRRLVARKAA